MTFLIVKKSLLQVYHYKTLGMNSAFKQNMWLNLQTVRLVINFIRFRSYSTFNRDFWKSKPTVRLIEWVRLIETSEYMLVLNTVASRNSGLRNSGISRYSGQIVQIDCLF